MKKRIITAVVMAFLMGGFCFTASADVVSVKNATEIFAGDNIDKLLDEYEKYVDQYIKVYNKAKKGDISAMSDYVKLAEKAQKLADKLEKAEEEMSAAQLKRYMNITEKMMKVISND